MAASMHPRHFLTILLYFSIAATGAARAQAPDALESRVSEIFARSCAIAGCHSGPQAMMSLDLSSEQYRASLLGRASVERPDLLLVHAGQPDSSYLAMKVRGDEGIVGLQMPFSGDKLTADEVGAIESWISGITEEEVAAVEIQEPAVYPFPGWKVINLPTARALPRRTLLFLISHRFIPKVSDGYDAFYGLDGGGIINMSLGYALSSRLLFALARTNEMDDVEAQLRYQIASQGGPRGLPIGLAVQGAVHRITADRPDAVEKTKFSLQVSSTRMIAEGLSAAVVPGVLTNPNEAEEGEPVLLTLGLGGRWNFYKGTSLVVEWTPMLSGYARTRTSGLINRYDNFGTGLEIATAGHVFQIVLTNALGLSTDQYLRGGDLDAASGELRLGFNIFRMINL